MPELFSRMDNLNWLTPSIADILDQGSTPPGGDGSIRERMLMIQGELEELDTPARIVNVRSTPSYTLYIARLGHVGRMGNRRSITPNEIKNSIKQIAENHKDWLLGFIPTLREDDNSVGILLRTDDHRPLSLRRLLVRGTFRKHPSTMAIVLGVTLEQQLIVDSIDSMGHLLVIGTENAKQHFIRSTLLSLIMLNTPSELRVAIAGESSEAHKYLVGAPHALGRILTSPAEGQRLIDGLVKEIQRRLQSLNADSASDIADYNEKAKQTGKPELPRIVLVLDSLTDDAWQDKIDGWSNSLSELLKKGKQVGIHLLITVDDEEKLKLPSGALDAVTCKVITRASSKDISANIPDFHASLLRFVDAFVVGQTDNQNRDIIPVELCAISNSEIKNVVEYWRQMSKKRYQDIQATQTSSKTGVTGVLTAVRPDAQATATHPTPPTPKKPDATTLSRATQLLGTQLATSVETGTIHEAHEKSVAPIVQIEETQRSDAIQRANISPDASTLVKQATALSAYLGWISRGALCDIFFISTEEAEDVLMELQKHHILEEADHPTLRFLNMGQSMNGEFDDI